MLNIDLKMILKFRDQFEIFQIPTWRFSPTPGKCWTTGMSRFFSWSAGPTPLKSSNWGELIAPPGFVCFQSLFELLKIVPQRITSPSVWIFSLFHFEMLSDSWNSLSLKFIWLRRASHSFWPNDFNSNCLLSIEYNFSTEQPRGYRQIWSAQNWTKIGSRGAASEVNKTLF